jgi:hypothetical protein
LLADQRAVGEFLPASLEPRHHLAFEEAAQALGVGFSRRLIPVKFVWIAGKGVSPPSLRIVAQRC